MSNFKKEQHSNLAKKLSNNIIYSCKTSRWAEIQKEISVPFNTFLNVKDNKIQQKQPDDFWHFDKKSADNPNIVNTMYFLKSYRGHL